MKSKDKKADANAHEWYDKGCELKRAGNLMEAVASFKKAIDCDAQFADAYFTRGACYYLMGRYQLAGMDMDAATLLGCQDAQLWSRFDMQCFMEFDEDKTP